MTGNSLLKLVWKAFNACQKTWCRMPSVLLRVTERGIERCKDSSAVSGDIVSNFAISLLGTVHVDQDAGAPYVSTKSHLHTVTACTINYLAPRQHALSDSDVAMQALRMR